MQYGDFTAFEPTFQQEASDAENLELQKAKRDARWNVMKYTNSSGLHVEA